MNERPGFFLCICPDGQLVKRQVATQLATWPPAPVAGGLMGLGGGASGGSGAGAALEWETHVFWGDDELPRTFWELLTLQGLMARPRALVLRNAQALPAEVWKRLSQALGRPNPQTWPIICLGVAFDKGQPKIPAHLAKLPCFAFAEERGWVWRSPGLDERSLGRHIQGRARELGLRLSPEALETLTISLPPDAAAVDSELAKLSLLSGGETVTPESAGLATFTSDFNIFQFLRALTSGQAETVWAQSLHEQARGDDLIFPLLGLLQREARLLWQVLAGETAAMRPQDIPAKKQLAARLGPAGLARLWDVMHTAELSIKSGRRSPAQALNALVGDLTLLFR